MTTKSMEELTTWRKRALFGATADPFLWGALLFVSVYLAVMVVTGWFPVRIVAGRDGLKFSADAASVLFQLAAYLILGWAFLRYFALSTMIRGDRLSVRHYLERFQSSSDVMRSYQHAMAISTAHASRGLAGDRLICELQRLDNLASTSSLNEVVDQCCAPRYTSHRYLVQLQRPVLNLGILGTFVGLVLAMTALADKLQTGSESRTDGSALLTELFNSVQTCFTTSVAGVVCAMVIGFLSARCERMIDRLAEPLRALATTAVGLSEQTTPGLPHDAVRLSRVLRSVVRSIVEQNGRIEDQTKIIGQGMQALRAEKASLDDFLSGVAAIRTALVGEIKAVRFELSPQDLARRMERELGEFCGVVTTRLESSLKELFTGIAAACDALNASRKAMEIASDALRGQSEGMHPRSVHQSNEDRCASFDPGAFIHAVTGSIRIALDQQRVMLPDERQIIQAISDARNDICDSIRRNGRNGSAVKVEAGI